MSSMMRYRVRLAGALVLILACRPAHGAVTLEPIALPSTEGTIVATAFSPDSSRIVIVRHLAEGPGTSTARHTVQVVNLESAHEISKADLPNGEPFDMAMSAHFIRYSFDGRYLVLGTGGADVLLILDAIKLQVVNRIVLHPGTQHRRSLSEEGNRHFQGVISLAVASNVEMFGVLTHDEQLGVNEVFIGSFSSGRVIKSWILSYGRAQTGLGQTSLSLSEDGSRTAVSLVPPASDKLPKDFNSIRVYNSNTGELLAAIRTDGLAGQIAVGPGGIVFASRIDTPSLFSKKACIEKWNFGKGVIIDRFCDQGRHVILLGVSQTSNLLAGFGCYIKKDLEGNVYSIPGRIDVWDMKSGALIAYSGEIPRLASADIQISQNGSWLLANQTLFRIGIATAGHTEAQIIGALKQLEAGRNSAAVQVRS
jgi:hypothetical protein